MKIEINKSIPSMTVLIEGSIDTVTAPALESKLKENWNDVTELILDFSGVDYISSAGCVLCFQLKNI